MLPSHQCRQFLCAIRIAEVMPCFYFVPPWQESPLYVSVLLGWRLRLNPVSSILNMSFGYQLIILGSSSLFQSITVLGFTMVLSPDTVLYTRLCIFLKWSIQPSEVRKPLILRRAATCTAFPFRWGYINGCAGSMGLLEPHQMDGFKFFQWQSLQ